MKKEQLTFFRSIFIILGSLVLLYWSFGLLFAIGIRSNDENSDFTIFITFHIFTTTLCLWFVAHQIKELNKIHKKAKHEN